MSEVLRGMGISAGILLPVVVLFVVISMAAVRRGEAAMRGEAHGGLHEPVPAYIPGSTGAAVAAAKAAKPAVVTTEDVSVIEILLFGLLLFGLTIFALLGLSILRHL